MAGAIQYRNRGRDKPCPCPEALPRDRAALLARAEERQADKLAADAVGHRRRRARLLVALRRTLLCHRLLRRALRLRVWRARLRVARVLLCLLPRALIARLL